MMESASEYVLRLLLRIYSNVPTEDLVAEAIFPIWILTPETDLTLTGPEELAAALDLFRKGVADLGVVQVRPELVSVVGDGRHLSTITLINHRLGIMGEDMGSHRATYVVENDGHRWFVRSMSVGDLPDTGGVRKRLGALFAREFQGRGDGATEMGIAERAIQ